jgi:3-hydroxybutyryl-CoA dehydrogenase
MNKVTATTEWSGFGNADLIIEAVFESLDLKRGILLEIEAVTAGDAVFASNTSSIPISRIAEGSKHPEAVLGMHYFSPVAAMKLLELVIGEKTSQETIDAAVKVGEKQGKTTVQAKNSPGFIVNRILMPVLREGIILYEQGVATKEEIDTAMTVHGGMPAGPFALGDFVGLDIAYHAMSTLYRELGDCFKPPETLKNLVESGAIGTKAKKGFYDYSGAGGEAEPAKGADLKWLSVRIAVMAIREAMILVDTGIASKEDVDPAMVLGASFPKGPFAMAEDIGMDKDDVGAIRDPEIVPNIDGIRWHHQPCARCVP